MVLSIQVTSRWTSEWNDLTNNLEVLLKIKMLFFFSVEVTLRWIFVCMRDCTVMRTPSHYFFSDEISLPQIWDAILPFHNSFTGIKNVQNRINPPWIWWGSQNGVPILPLPSPQVSPRNVAIKLHIYFYPSIQYILSTSRINFSLYHRVGHMAYICVFVCLCYKWRHGRYMHIKRWDTSI